MDNVKFERGPAHDGIHDNVQYNEYRKMDERAAAIVHAAGGTLLAVGLLLAYAFAGWLDG